VGESETSGRVGSTATINIDAGSRQIGGNYQIAWSDTAIGGEEGIDYIVLAEGQFPRETTKVAVNFTVPEAAYGTHYVQYLRPAKDPYGFAFTVLPGIKVSPASGLPGAKLTVKGTGFPANKDIDLGFDGQDTGLPISANGIGSFSVSFTIPNTIAGKHEFKATVENMSLGDLTASLQVSPKISLSPEQPDIGAEVTLTGRGFAASSQVSIKYDDISISSSPTTDQNGSFSHSFNAPESPEDDHVITATDKAGNTATYGLMLEGEPPPVPSTISPAKDRFGTFGAQLVTFTWTDVFDPSGITYTLEIDDNLSFFPLEPGMRKTGLTKPTCTLRLGPGTYYWRVKAVDGAGNESDWSLSPYQFQVGLFSTWVIVGMAIAFLIAFIFIVRAFFRRIREYYK
jgi:hypothetical protein